MALIILFVFTLGFGSYAESQPNIENTWQLVANGCGLKNDMNSIDHLFLEKIQRTSEETLIFENGNFSSSRTSHLLCDYRSPLEEQLIEGRYVYCSDELLNVGTYEVIQNKIYLNGRVLKNVPGLKNAKGLKSTNIINFAIIGEYLILNYTTFNCGTDLFFEVYESYPDDLLF